MKYMCEIYSVILYELKRNGGSMNEKELYEAVTKRLEDFEIELTPRDLNKALLVLEARGLITVAVLKKNMRMVKLLSV